MTTEEADKIIRILLTADGGCGHCVGDLMEAFAQDFPAFRDAVGEAYRAEFGKYHDSYDPVECREWVDIDVKRRPIPIPVRCNLNYGHSGEHGRAKSEDP